MKYVVASRESLRKLDIPDCIVGRYDSQGRPVYRNIYYSFLLNDELSLPELKSLATVGFASDRIPRELNACIVAYLCNSIGEGQSSLEHMRLLSHAEYAKRRARLTELRAALRDKTIAPTHDGWIGFGFETGSDRVKAARITRASEVITTEVEYLEAGRWNVDELDKLKMSDEYRRILLWLYDNDFLHS